MAVTNIDFDVQGARAQKYSETASGAIAFTTSALTKPAHFNLLTLHLDAAPTTSENLTVTLDSRLGADYDTLLYSIDLSASSVTDLVLDESDFNALLGIGDALAIAYTNTDAGTYGLELTLYEGAE
jgi:hypothetical protein